MSEKSIIGVIVSAFTGGPRSKGLTTVEQRCPICHNALDPRWSKCPYCEAIQNSENKSSRVMPQPENSAAPPSRRAAQVEAGAAPGPTSAAGAGRRHTVVDATPSRSPARERAGGGRRLVGILTSFTWSRLGQLFEVRDGRNYGGSGTVSTDNDNPCEILVSEDHTMSGAHFLILCQGGKYIISDNFSTNGTFVNEAQIDTRGMELPDDAVIKAGATVFSFQKIHAVPGAATEPAGTDDRGWKPGSGEETVV